MWIFNSSIGRKLIMSLSGLFLISFLIVHLSANLALLAGTGGATSVEEIPYNVVCHFMDTNPLIMVMVPVLALGFIVHIVYAFILTAQNRKARGNDRYASSSKTNISWASKNMFVLGIIVLGFLGLHLVHFWAKMQLQHFIGGTPDANAYQLAVNLFTNPAYVVIYIIWIWALWFHLTHGFWSAFQSMGLNNHNWMPRWKALGSVLATLIAVGFTIIPLFFLFGFGQ
ncbi:MAG: succinate dehydrogenase cytochrome b subunit [Bacteroidales bacterium]